MNAHENFQLLADAAAAGEMPEAELQDALKHADSCAQCGQILRDAREFAQWMSRAANPPKNLQDDIIARLGLRRRRKLPLRALGGIAAAVVLVLLGHVYVLKEMRDSRRVLTEVDSFSKRLEAELGRNRDRELKLSDLRDKVGKMISEKSASAQELPYVKQELERSVKDLASLEERYVTLLKDKRKLEDMMESLRLAGIDLSKFPPVRPINGKIMSFSSEAGTAIINQGKDAGSTVGMKFTIYRGDKFVATAIVKEAERKWSALAIELKYLDPEVGDIVSNHMLLGSNPPSPGPGAAEVQAQGSRWPQDAKIVRDGRIELEVDSYADAFGKVERITAEAQGQITDADTRRLANGKIRATITVRVPPDQFQAAVGKLSALGLMRSQTLRTEDVTRKHVDLGARLGAKQALSGHLEKLISQGKGTIRELTEAEVQAGSVREEIDRILGEIKHLEGQVAMSAIVLEVSEKDLGQPFELVQTLQASIGLTASDPRSAFDRALKAISDAGGQVIDSKLVREADSAGGVLKARVAADRFPSLREALAALGHIHKDQTSEQKTGRGGDAGAPGADAPVRRELAAVDLTIQPAPRVVTLKARISVETSDVESACRAARLAIQAAGGQVRDGSLTIRADAASGQMRAEVDADTVAALVEKLKAQGRVKTESSDQTIPPPGIAVERADVELSIQSPSSLIREDQGLGAAFRDTVSGSFAGLVWSLEHFFIGLSLAGPWLVLILVVWLAYRLARKRRAKPAAL